MFCLLCACCTESTLASIRCHCIAALVSCSGATLCAVLSVFHVCFAFDFLLSGFVKVEQCHDRAWLLLSVLIT